MVVVQNADMNNPILHFRFFCLRPQIEMEVVPKYGWIYQFYCSFLFLFSSFFTVQEESGFARIPVVRLGGSYGLVSATYTAKNGTATIGRDFALPNGTLSLGNGVTSTHINVTIIDDVVREFSEQFQIELTSATGKYIFKSPLSAALIIHHSRY